jgi:MFS family permease
MYRRRKGKTMQSEKTNKQPLLTPIMRWFLFAMVLANIAGMMSPMLMPIYLTELGADIGDVGLVFTLTSISILVLQIFGGWVSDSIGRLRAVAIGSVGGIIGLVAMLLAPTWQWMIVAMSIYQIPFALVGPSFQAFIAENSAEENRGKVFGMTNSIYQITGIVGPPLGGLLAGAFGFKWMLAASGLLYAMAAGLRIWMATTMKSQAVETTGEKLSMASFKTSMVRMLGMLLGGGVITWIFLTDGIADIAFRMSGELQPLFLEQIAGIGVEQIGLLGSINAVAAMFVPMLSGKLVDKQGERLPLMIGFFLIFVAFMIFLQAQNFLTFAVSWAVFGFGGGMLGPAYQSLITKVVPNKMLGTFSGVFYSSRGLIALPAPWLGAQLWERFSPQTPFIVTAAASLIILAPIYFKFKAPEKAEKPQENIRLSQPVEPTLAEAID